MTARDLVALAAQYQWHLTALFVVLPLVSGLMRFAHGQGRGGLSPWKYLYSVMIYLSCVPGILAAILTGYALFFTKENLLDVNLVIYMLPIVSMAVTLIIIAKSVSFDDIPGFDRISGLMVLLAITFVLVLAIQKTRIWLLFGGSIYTLIGLVVGLYALLKWGAYMLFRRKDEPLIKPPSLKLR
jgi:hypothetical protein